MQINTKLHTVYLLVGSTECGKSTFTEKILRPGLQFEDTSKGFKTNIQVISSDQIRQELLGHEYDKYDQLMLEASAQAFELLYTRLNLVTSFPINAEFVIIDTTGLSADFREKVRDIARANQYRVEVIIFDYKDRDDYYTSERSHRLISNHLSRLRKEVMPVVAKEKYDAIHKIKKKDFLENPTYQVTIENKEAFLATLLLQNQEYAIIGDVHECVDELQGLIKQFDFDIQDGRMIPTEKSQNKKLILVGDWIDKGQQTGEIIDFLYLNQDHFLLTLGNHENFVYKYLHGEIGGSSQETIDSYFTSIPYLRENAEAHTKFNQLVSISQPFFRYQGLGEARRSFYITHSPCKNKYLGKLDHHSLRHQRTFKLIREDDTETQIKFIEAEAVTNHPYHFFGHVAAKESFKLKNKVHLDTGCASGNKLIGVDVSFKLFFKSQKSENQQLKEELPILFKRERKVNLQDLSPEQERRLKYCANNKINFISGTMSPADKDIEANELESLTKGLDYFKDQGVNKIVLQPKYMGSRCNIYLHQEIEKCFAVSRNGYIFKGIDFSEIYKSLLQRFGSYMSSEKIEMILLDGEILPWQAAGEGLIEGQFMPISKALETELSFLEKNGFDLALDQLLTDFENTDFAKDQNTMSKSALLEKYGSATYQNFKSAKEIIKSRMPLEVHREAFKTYQRQLDLYGRDAELEYKPFGVLKMVKENGAEVPFEGSQSEIYQFLNDDPCLVLDLGDCDAYEKARAFYHTLTTDQGMEGVVIKPEYAQGGVAPYLKVRNEDYLSIVYGYDYKFPHKYEKLIKQKRVGKKLRTSMNEWRIGGEMLAVKLADIAPDHAGYKRATANMLFEVEKEKEIDPRL